MSFNLNKVMLAGNITNDLEFRRSSAGIPYVRFTIATNERKSNGEQATQFINCSLFGKSAEALCTYCSKGSAVYVEGKLTIGQYKDRNYPDVTHFTPTVMCSMFSFTSNKPAAEAPAAAGNVAAPVAQPAPRAAQQPTQQNASGFRQGDLNPNDFEEIISDDQLPF